MNIQHLQKLISRSDEIRILGKTAEVNGIIGNVIGIVRQESSLRLMVLQYDEDFVRRAEDNEIAALNGLPRPVQTNRQRLRGDREVNFNDMFHSVSKVTLGAVQFDIEETETTRCNEQNWEIITKLIEFLKHGWKPDSIDYQDIDNLLFTVIKLRGEFALIPDLGENPVLQLELRPEMVSSLIEQPFTLSFGAEYTDKFWFSDKKTGDKHWIQINSVYLYDMWAETMKNFNDPQFKERMSPVEIEKAKANFESHLSTICQKGMCFPVVEYECEAGLTLEFYTKAWLDAEPVNNSSCIGFLVKPDKKNGVLGLPLKAALIQEPVPENTKSIEVELFLKNMLKKYEDIII